MNRNIKIALAIVVILAAIGGAYAYYLVGTPTKAPSQPNAPTNNEAQKAPPTPLPEPSENVPDALTATGTERIFRLDSSSSTATFTLNEVLRGEPKTVIGTTSNVSGEIALDRQNLEEVRIGTIRINARTFKTDNEQRNRAIVRMIFKSEDDANEFIEFKPTKVTINATSTANGQFFPFVVTGDLSISGAKRPATFEGKAQFLSNTELMGSVETTVRYGDYGLSVPQLPFLANVDEVVKLRLDFLATQ